MWRRCAGVLLQHARLAPSVSSVRYSTDVGDLVILKGLVFHGYHGVLPEERSLGQKFIVDATLSTSLREAGESDDLNHTINYAAVYNDIKGIVEGKPADLIETVAERVSKRIFDKYDRVHSARIRVKKPHVAVDGVVEYLGVEITRRRP